MPPRPAGHPRDRRHSAAGVRDGASTREGTSRPRPCRPPRGDQCLGDLTSSPFRDQEDHQLRQPTPPAQHGRGRISRALRDVPWACLAHQRATKIARAERRLIPPHDRQALGHYFVARCPSPPCQDSADRATREREPGRRGRQRSPSARTLLLQPSRTAVNGREWSKPLGCQSQGLRAVRTVGSGSRTATGGR